VDSHFVREARLRRADDSEAAGPSIVIVIAVNPDARIDLRAGLRVRHVREGSRAHRECDQGDAMTNGREKCVLHALGHRNLDARPYNSHLHGIALSACADSSLPATNRSELEALVAAAADRAGAGQESSQIAFC
jgi:hypothetical protein